MPPQSNKKGRLKRDRNQLEKYSASIDRENSTKVKVSLSKRFE